MLERKLECEAAAMIDLHVHSTASDGTDTPSKLAETGRSLSVMALTDHDNCDGVKEFAEACAACGAGRLNDISSVASSVRIAGVEFSVDPGCGYGKFHLLGLGIDIRSQRLSDFCKRILDGRNARNEKILARFSEIGIKIPLEELALHARGEVLARPHFAAWLAEHGYAGDRKEAFERYLVPSSPAKTNCYITRYRPDPVEAFEVIHSAGGVAVMAHPRYWTKDPRLLREGLERLKAAGLDGIEAVYQANEIEETIDHLRAAKEIGLCVTAGSDYHGLNKPTIALGMDVGDERRFLAPFFECLERRRREMRRQS
jgi:predicted metal-dependent phosphoesterase TrpH